RGGACEVDHDHDGDHRNRVPARIDLPLGQAEQPPESPPGDQQAGHDEDRGLAERREVLGLPVAVGVAGVGRPARDADRVERQQRRDEVGPRMGRLGEQAEAVRREPGDELDRDQHTGCGDRHERGPALGAHAGRISGTRKGPPWRALSGEAMSRSYAFAMSPWKRSLRNVPAPLPTSYQWWNFSPWCRAWYWKPNWQAFELSKHENVALGPKKAAIQTSVNPQSAAVQLAF